MDGLYGVRQRYAKRVAGDAERGAKPNFSEHARPIPEQGKWVARVVRGHIRYYGVPAEQNALCFFRFQVGVGSGMRAFAAQPTRRVLGIVAALITRCCLCLPSVILPPSRMGVSTKARAGCGSAPCPDPWRGLCANMIPTPPQV